MVLLTLYYKCDDTNMYEIEREVDSGVSRQNTIMRPPFLGGEEDMLITLYQFTTKEMETTSMIS